MNIYSKPRKPFSVDGIAQDQESIIRIRGEIESRIEEDMRSKGYVPALDVTPELFWEFQEDGTFKFAVIMYGVFVGKKQASSILGILGPHPIMKDAYE